MNRSKPKIQSTDLQGEEDLKGALDFLFHAAVQLSPAHPWTPAVAPLPHETCTSDPRLRTCSTGSATCAREPLPRASERPLERSQVRGAAVLGSGLLQTGAVIEASSPHQAGKAEKEELRSVWVMSGLISWVGFAMGGDCPSCRLGYNTWKHASWSPLLHQ